MSGISLEGISQVEHEVQDLTFNPNEVTKTEKVKESKSPLAMAGKKPI